MYLVFLRMNQFSSTCAWHAGKYKEAPHGRVTIWICRDEGCLPPQPRPRRRRAPRLCAWDSQPTIWRDCCSWRQVPGVQNKYVEWSRSTRIVNCRQHYCLQSIPVSRRLSLWYIIYYVNWCRGFFRHQCFSTCQAANFAASTSCTFGGLFWSTTLTCAQIYPVLSANAAG